MYRVLKRLEALGEARHIWLGRRYARSVSTDAPALSLVCSVCGSMRFENATALYQALRELAAGCGFKADEVITEVGGRCASCSNVN